MKMKEVEKEECWIICNFCPPKKLDFSPDFLLHYFRTKTFFEFVLIIIIIQEAQFFFSKR